MRRVLIIVSSCFLFTFVSANVLPGKPKLKASEVFIPVGKSAHLLSLEELSVISAKDLQTLTGEKMSFVEKISFKVGQRKLRPSIHADGTLDKKFSNYFEKRYGLFGMFNLGGLLLGGFLSLVGVLIAYLIKTGDYKGRIRWAWIGCIISFIVVGTILII